MDGEVLWEPPDDIRKLVPLGRYMSWLTDSCSFEIPDYASLWQWSVEDLPRFWESIWNHFDPIRHSEPQAILENPTMPGATWFRGSRLNFAENALRGQDDETVLVAVSQTRAQVELTRRELRSEVARVRAGLVRLGVRKGDRVVGFLPNIPETVAALLATASLGAVWASCAPEFGAQAVLDRLAQLEPKVLLAVDGYMYGAREVDRRAVVSEIASGLPTLNAVVLLSYLDPDSTLPGAIPWSAFDEYEGPLSFEATAFSDPLWVLFSSGTTGRPKAIVHGHGGIVLEQLKALAFHKDIGLGSRYFTFTTTGWTMWNILVSGLLLGASIVLMDGDPGHPEPGQLWRVAAATDATVVGCGAAYVVASREAGVRPASEYDLSGIWHGGFSGSPLPAREWAWLLEHVVTDGWIASSSGGTDICSGLVGGTSLLPIRAGEISCRCLGVDVDAYDERGRPVIGRPGELVVKQPIPSMPLRFWADPGDEHYRASYFATYPGVWRHGDWISFTSSGASTISGRSDATLNRGGVRLGTADFYSVVEALPAVRDSLAVHLEESAIGSDQLLLFVVVAPGWDLDDGLRELITHELSSRLSPRHVPDAIHQVPAIPRNVNGKKLEVPVKQVLGGADPGTVVDPASLLDDRAFDVFVELATGARLGNPVGS